MSTDDLIGQNLRRLRSARSQEALALAMTRLGWPSWDKSVVGKVELAKRALKLAEAVTLCKILGCTLDDLVARR